VKIRYKLVQNEATPVKLPQKPDEAQAELSPVERFQTTLQQAVDSKNKDALLALFNMEGVNAEDKKSIASVIDKIISWPGVKVECRRRTQSEPILIDRDGKKFTLNGKRTLHVSFHNTDPSLNKFNGPVFDGGQTSHGMRVLMQVETNQPAALSAQAVSDVGKGLFELHGVADAAGPTTMDYSLPQRSGGTETVHLESEVLLDYLALRSVKVEHDANGSCLRFTLDEEGARRFAGITVRRLGKRIGIIVDGKLLSAPVVRDPIFGGSLSISEDFSEQEANNLAAKLNEAIRMAPSGLIQKP